MKEINIRTYRPSDFGPVVSLWNRCLPKDPISLERFWRLYLLDPNLRADGLRVADADGKVVGYLQSIARRTPVGHIPDGPTTGFVTAFFVDPEYRRRGVGRRMMAVGLDALLEAGCGSVSCNGYAPYYAFPGVDHDYTEALDFLTAMGFAPRGEAVAMKLPLYGVRMPNAVRAKADALAVDGIIVRWFDISDTLPLLTFATAQFPDWVSGLAEGLQRNNRDIMVAVRGGSEVVGYTQWQNTQTDPPSGAPGRFGPFGVHPELRSKGIGAVIFWTLAESVAAAGARELWFGWAGGRNVSFYERAGCQVTRRFRLFRRELG